MPADGFLYPSLFEDLRPDQRALLRPLLLPRQEPKGAAIFEQGELAEFLFILVDGEVNLRYKPEDGPELTIKRVRPESVIGWSAALGNPVYTSSAISATDCHLLAMRSRDLRRLCDTDPLTGSLILEHLASAIAERLRNTHQQVIALLEQGLCININQMGDSETENTWLDSPANSENQPTPGATNMDMNGTASFTEEERLIALIDRISAYIEHFHGGSVEMVSYDGKTLKVKLGGACLGCPLSPNTLHGWVEGTVRQFFPNIERVESVA